MARSQTWYSSYDKIADEVKSIRDEFSHRCEELGHAATNVINAFSRDLLARTVHESNWQEGVELEFGRTRELTELAMDDLRFSDDARLDLQSITDTHRDTILRMKRKGASFEEIATVNLARAHMLLQWIAEELAFRQTASLASALRHAEPFINNLQAQNGRTVPPEVIAGLETLRELERDAIPAYGPLQGCIGTHGELLSRLLDTDFQTLLHPMDVRYIHALHRITMMGVIRSDKLGRWRRGMVHVGNPNVVFPPPELLDSLMSEYCSRFPTILPNTVKYDPIRTAARASYDFVRIHPYCDGNGRVSRLLMNLVLWGHHPLISIAPRAKERHRYAQALKRSDRGQREPMACLVGIAVRDTYKRMLEALVTARK